MWEYKRYIKYIVFEKPRVYQSLQTSIPTMITQMIKYMIYIGFFFQKNPKNFDDDDADDGRTAVGSSSRKHGAVTGVVGNQPLCNREQIKTIKTKLSFIM